MIVLTILKWIGIVLLCILGFLLVLLLLILFSPIRYDVNADIDPPAGNPDPDASSGKETNDPSTKPSLQDRSRARVRVRYLFSALRGRFDWPTEEGGDPFSVYLLFFRLFPRKKKEKPERKKKNRSGDDAEAEIGVTQGSAEEGGAEDDARDAGDGTNDAPGCETKDDGTTETEEIEAQDGEGDADTSAYEARTEDGESSETADSKGEEWKKTRSEKPPFRPQIVIKKMYYTISGTCAKIGMVRATIESSVYFRAKRVLLNETRRVMKQILPRGTRVILTFGAEDPKTTGDVMALVGMLYPVFLDSVQVTPVFDDETLYGMARVKGKIIPAVLAFSFLRCYFNRDIRKIIKRVKKIREVNHGREQE